MRGVAKQLGRVVVVLTAALAQFVPASLAMSCERGCCSTAAGTSCCSQIVPQIVPQGDQGDGQCPLCHAAEAAACVAEPAAVPCHCQLDARDDDAKTADSRTTIDVGAPLAVAPVASIATPPDAASLLALGSADHVRPALSRPVRILYGVWRN
jgi:hypothetical protein